MRLIDKDLLEPDTEWDGYEDWYMSYSKTQIDNAPTVDAVPVVRCKDCVNHNNCITEDVFIFAGCTEDGFCWAGARKENE